MDNLLHKLDQIIIHTFSQWDIYSTTLFTGMIAFVAYQVITSRDPDAHPILLARQSQASPVRQPGESAVYRSHAAPHGMPLSAGLNVKDEGDPKWSAGRNGDLRDVWRRVVGGVEDRDGKKTGEVGKILTVMGKEQVIEHELGDITRQINLVGQHIRQNKGVRVAVYLPNSVELLATLFACTFYDLTVVLLPYDQSNEDILPLLQKSKVDTVIAAVGSFPFDSIAKGYPHLRQMIWVVDEGSKHLDWNEVPSGTGGSVNVSTWQDIVQDAAPYTGTEVLPVDKKSVAKPILAFWPTGELVEYTQANLIAGIAGQLSSLPTVQRFTSTDTFLPVESLSTVYPLILTLAALYTSTTVILNSVAGHSPNLALATQGASPTTIVASASTIFALHSSAKAKLPSSLYNAIHYLQTRSLIQNGVMPLATIFSRMFDHLRPVIGNTPGKLRLIYVSEQVSASTHPLSAEMLSDVRIYTGARVVYALTAKEVAGSVCQTGLYDYRVGKGNEKYSHFGAPVASLEVSCRDTKVHKTTDEEAKGEIVVKGPAVVGGMAALGVAGRMQGDGTLALL